MTALDKLETVAACITGLVVLGFVTAYDSKAKGTDQYRKAVKRFTWALVGIPIQMAVGLIGMMIGVAAFTLRPTSTRISQYSQWRMHRGAHRAVAY